MKYAIISDIHGNFAALSAVLSDAKKEKVDQFIFVGDYYMSLPYPNEVLNALQNIPNKWIVRGNEENYLEHLDKQDKMTWTDGQMRTLYWCYHTISAENKQFLAQLPHRIDIVDENMNIHITHSSADFIGSIEHQEFSSSKTTIKYKDKPVSHEILMNDMINYLHNNMEFQEILNTISDGIYIFGHSHLQWYARFQNKIFINPGSCGLPLDCFDNGAPYTILQIEKNKLIIDERRVSYDLEATVSSLRTSELYKQAHVWCELIIGELTTHREHIDFFLEFAEEYAKKIGDAVRPFSLETWEDAYQSWIKSRE